MNLGALKHVPPFNGAIVEMIFTLPLLSIPGDDLSRFRSDETAFFQPQRVFAYRVLTHPNCLADGFVAGPALVGLAVFTPSQVPATATTLLPARRSAPAGRSALTERRHRAKQTEPRRRWNMTAPITG